jgi:hypothetical protein
VGGCWVFGEDAREWIGGCWGVDHIHCNNEKPTYMRSHT